ncbi:prolipoprotein diacylglyceryl transferase [Candidatus Mycoplasma mahonii]|uniref:prolipoprotein diacylglyceryl transferase n=1 Tax=Candidatus Mycoplasma mahonii TaxID=3004105 RepID=UPI0026EF5563|nr:prolipoprotein diacylglyceryl transferase [Candidatus Mycoplasma mahonii]WKX02505.1 prolipoprotein diacylglyceryl transferase [Candidatus Mycoplasma mahonii]
MNYSGYDWDRGEKTWTWSFVSIYPITMMLGIIFSFLTITYFWKRQKYSWEILQMLLIIVIPSSILGARIWFGLSGSLNIFSSTKSFFEFRGLSIHGGVLGAIAAGGFYLLFRRHVVDIRTVAGIIIPSVLLGQVIGRWGNFANHEVYGKIVENPSSLDWLTFIKPYMFIDGHFRQPFFFYESMLNLLGYIIIVWVVLRKNSLKPGTTAALYLIWYGIVRVIMEPLRDKADIMMWGTFQVSVLMSILWLLAGVILFIWFQFFTNPGKLIKKYCPWIKDRFKLIQPVKTRKLFWFGKKSDTKKKYIFWGKVIPNKINIWLHIYNSEEWSKRELNRVAKGKGR